CTSSCTSTSSSRSGASTSSGARSTGCAPCAGATIPLAPPRRHRCRPRALPTCTRKPSSTPARGTRFARPSSRSCPCHTRPTPTPTSRPCPRTRTPHWRSSSSPPAPEVFTVAPRILREGRHHLCGDPRMPHLPLTPTPRLPHTLRTPSPLPCHPRLATSSFPHTDHEGKKISAVETTGTTGCHFPLPVKGSPPSKWSH
ncbi:hypothetical protein B0H14DRAFT_3710298, partial [Mycena olivaceomarginata]